MAWGQVAAILGGQLLSEYGKYRAAKKNRQAQREHADREYRRQKEFAQKGTTWKINQARAAGLSPLAVLGGGSSFYSPSAQIGGSQGESIATGLGQSISRAASAYRSPDQRNKELENLAVTNAKLKNEFLRAKIRSEGRRLQGSNQGLLDVRAQRVLKHEPGRPDLNPGAVADTGFARTKTGLAPVPGELVKERIEDQLIPETMWALRNYGKANFGIGKPSRRQWKKAFPKAIGIWYDRFNQEWRPYYKKDVPNTKTWSGYGKHLWQSFRYAW